MKHAIDWFEIFVADLERAVRFYEDLLDVGLRREEFGGAAMAVFPEAAGGVGGALVQDARRAGSGSATLVYLNATGKLDPCLERAGAAVVLPKTDIGAPGFIATVRDPDGNLVGLHSER